MPNENKVYILETPSIDVGEGENADDACRREMAGLISGLARAVQGGYVDWKVASFRLDFKVEVNGLDVKFVMRVYADDTVE